MATGDLNVTRLRELVSYDPETGAFRRTDGRLLTGAASRNAHVGWINGQGYHCLRVDRKEWLGHRLAWVLMAGELPTGEVDHRDGQRANNRWENLRDVAHRHNIENQRRPARSGSTGYLGVTLHKASGLFHAQIKSHGKHISLGYFKRPEDAHAAYVEAKRLLHTGCTL